MLVMALHSCPADSTEDERSATSSNVVSLAAALHEVATRRTASIGKAPVTVFDDLGFTYSLWHISMRVKGG